jgi:A/G-specific adenine glycosylase
LVAPSLGEGVGGGASFSDRLIRWHKLHGRHDLPWQNTRDPYRVWLSEIMLQQTQVATVMPYYARFLERFATLADLANAPVEDVMALWSGLGYYARARNLHKCAQTVMATHGGEFPRNPIQLEELPGIGRSTANSIATFCFGAKAPILDGNVKRVICRAFGIEGFPGSSAVEKRLWSLVDELMPAQHGDIYNQAQMDLGATVCTRSKPLCQGCPLSDTCSALKTGRVAELPQPKPRKQNPERAATLLVVIDERKRILLETRPPTGIWGGLLSLPELTAGDAALWLQQHLGSPPIAVSPAGRPSGRKWPVEATPTFVHVFSHFRLRITPIVCHVGQVSAVMEPSWQWLARELALKAALPAPVRKIIESLAAV